VVYRLLLDVCLSVVVPQEDRLSLPQAQRSHGYQDRWVKLATIGAGAVLVCRDSIGKNPGTTCADLFHELWYGTFYMHYQVVRIAMRSSHYLVACIGRSDKYVDEVWMSL
jgi:hypothetical protein